MSKQYANETGSGTDELGFAKLAALARMLNSLLPIKDRKKILTLYRNCFSAKEAIEVLLSNKVFAVRTYDQATTILQALVRQRFLIRAQPSENKAISALPTNILSHRELFSESPDSLYQFTTLCFSEDPSEKARRRAEADALARAIPTPAVNQEHRGSVSRVDGNYPYDYSKNSNTISERRPTSTTTSAPVFTPEESSTMAPPNATLPVLATPSAADSNPPTMSLPPTPSSTNSTTPHPPSAPCPPSLRNRGKKLVSQIDEEETKVFVDEKPDFSGISSDTYIAPHTNNTKHLGQSLGKTPGGINIRVNVRQTGNVNTLPRHQNLRINTNSAMATAKEYNIWYKDMCGFLEKKRDKGLNMSWYQRRYFRLEVASRALVYYSSPDETFPLGFIPLHDVSSIQYIPDKKNGRRFDVLTYGRVYSLKAESVDLATQWVAALTACIQHLHLGQACFSKRRPLPQPKTPKTPIMMRFFWNPKNPLEVIPLVQQTNASATLAVSAPRRNSHSLNSRNSTTRTMAQNPNLMRPEYVRGLVDEFGNSIVDSYEEFKKTGSVRYQVKTNRSPPLTTLKLLFYQLNFTTSRLDEPDNFKQIVEQFQTDEDIFNYLLEVLLTDDPDKAASGNSVLHPAEIEESTLGNNFERYGENKADRNAFNEADESRDKFGSAGLNTNHSKLNSNLANSSFSKLSSTSGSHASLANILFDDGAPRPRGRHRRSNSNSSVEITSSMFSGTCPSRILPAVHDPNLSPLALLLPITTSSHVPELAVVDSGNPNMPRHRRSRSDPGLEPVANTRETNAVVADNASKREHFIHKISATTASRSFNSMTMRQRTKTWLSSSYFYQDVVCGPYITSYERLALPLIWTLLLARHHEEEGAADEYEDEEYYYESENDFDSHHDGVSRTRNTSRINKGNTFTAINTALLANTSVLGLLRHMKTAAQNPPLIRQQKHMFSTIPNCIVAREFVDWLVKNRYCDLPEEAVTIGNLLVSHNIFHSTSPARKFKRNNNLWAVQDLTGLIGLLDNIDSPFKEKRWGNMVGEDGSIFGIQTQFGNNSSSDAGDQVTGVTNLNMLPGFGNTTSSHTKEELHIMQQRLQGSWLNTVSLAQLITGLSPNHWRTKWTPTCRCCQQAAAHFTELVSRFCSFFSYVNPVVDVLSDAERELNPLSEGSGMDLVTTNSVLSVLVTAPQDMMMVQSPVRDEFSVFSRAVQNAGVWRALFTGLYSTAPHLRRRALQHVSGLMVCMPQGSENALSLSIVPCWSDWVLSMLDDTDATLRSKDRVRDKVFKFAMNIIAMVLHEVFISKDCVTDEEPATALDAIAVEWAAPMIAAPTIDASSSSMRASMAVAPSNGIEMIDPRKTFLYPQDASRLTSVGGSQSLAPSNININSLDIDISASNTNPNLAPCIYPHRRAGFALPLSIVGAASMRRPKCYKAQLLDAVLSAMSRSTVKDFSFVRTILSTQIMKISTKLRSRYSLPIHERLSQISFLMMLIRSFVFMVPLSPDGEMVTSMAHVTNLHVPASAFQLNSQVYNCHEDILDDLETITGNLLKENALTGGNDPNRLRKDIERLQLFNEKACFNGGVNTFGYGNAPNPVDFLKDTAPRNTMAPKIGSPSTQAGRFKERENSVYRRSGQGTTKSRFRRDSYSHSQGPDVSRIGFPSFNESFNAELGGRQSIHMSRHQMQNNAGSGYHSTVSISNRAPSSSRAGEKSQITQKLEAEERDKELARQERIKEEQFKQAGGGLHWREKEGIEEDMELLEKAIGLLRQLHIIEAPTINIAADEDGTISGQRKTRADTLRSSATTKAEIAAERENMMHNTRTPPQEVWHHLNMLAGHYADERLPTIQECDHIRRIQTIGEFFKESLTYLSIMKERLYILTPAQVTSSTKEFVTMRNRHKIFTTKLTF